MNTTNFKKILEDQSIILHPQVKNLIQFLAYKQPIPDFLTVDLNYNAQLLHTHTTEISYGNKEQNYYCTLNPIEQLLMYVPYEHWKKYMNINIFSNLSEKSISIALLVKQNDFLKDVRELLNTLKQSATEEILEIPISQKVQKLPFKNYSTFFKNTANESFENTFDNLPLLFVKGSLSAQNSEDKINDIIKTTISFSSFFQNHSTYFKIMDDIFTNEPIYESQTFFEWLVRTSVGSERKHEVDELLTQFSPSNKKNNYKSANFKDDKKSFFYQQEFFIISTFKKFLQKFASVAMNNDFSIHKEALEDFFLKELKQLAKLSSNIAMYPSLINDILEIDSLADTKITEKFLTLTKSNSEKLNLAFKNIFTDLAKQSSNSNDDTSFRYNQVNQNHFSNLYFNNLKINKAIELIEHFSQKHSLNIDSGYEAFIPKESKIFNNCTFTDSEETFNFLSFNTSIQFLIFCYKDNNSLRNESTKKQIQIIKEKSLDKNLNISYVYNYLNENNKNFEKNFLIKNNINGDILNNYSEYLDKFFISSIVEKNNKHNKKLKF